MNFERMQDVIDHARYFHNQLSAHFKSLNDQAQQERVRMLIDYLKRQESHMAAVLEQFEANASPGLLETYFQYTAPLHAEADKLRQEPDLSLDEVINHAIRFDEKLVDLYRTLAREADVPAVREVCEKLLLLEEEQRRNRSRSISELQQDI